MMTVIYLKKSINQIKNKSIDYISVSIYDDNLEKYCLDFYRWFYFHICLFIFINCIVVNNNT